MSKKTATLVVELSEEIAELKALLKLLATKEQVDALRAKIDALFMGGGAKKPVPLKGKRGVKNTNIKKSGRPAHLGNIMAYHKHLHLNDQVDRLIAADLYDQDHIDSVMEENEVHLANLKGEKKIKKQQSLLYDQFGAEQKKILRAMMTDEAERISREKEKKEPLAEADSDGDDDGDKTEIDE
jgi:hypothetical protein